MDSVKQRIWNNHDKKNNKLSNSEIEWYWNCEQKGCDLRLNKKKNEKLRLKTFIELH